MAILDLVGLGHVSSEGQQWAVNQVSTEISYYFKPNEILILTIL